MNKMGSIIKFTFLNKVKTKSFMITTLIIVLLLSIGMNIPYMITLFQGDKADTPAGGFQIGIVAQENDPVYGYLQDYAALNGLPEDSLSAYPSAEDAGLRQAVDNGDIEGYVVLEPAAEGGAPAVTYASKGGEVSGPVRAFLESGLQQANVRLLAGGGLSAEQAAAATAPVVIGTQDIDPQAGAGPEDAPPVINYVIVYVLLILFFMAIMMTGNMIAAEITSEKSSRIMEILITSASPLAQMFGKVIGVFLVGLLQIGVYAAATAINIMLPHNASILTDFDLDFGAVSIDLIVFGLILYVLGYFLYALMYAAVGSIVSRTEDLGQAIMPIMMLGFAAFYIPLFSISNADSMLVKISSYVPFTSPLALLLRIGVGEIALWEILLSVVILLATTLLFGWLAAKIYRTGVLMYGKRPTFKELRKAMKAYKI